MVCLLFSTGFGPGGTPCYSPKFTIVPPSHCPSETPLKPKIIEPVTNREKRLTHANILSTRCEPHRAPKDSPGGNPFHAATFKLQRNCDCQVPDALAGGNLHSGLLLEYAKLFCHHRVVSHRSHYRLPAASAGAGGLFFWLFALLVIAIAGFVWWTSRKPAPKFGAQNRAAVVVATNPIVALPRVSAVSSVVPTMSNRPPGNVSVVAATNRIVTAIPASTNKPVALVTGDTPVVTAAPASGFPRPPRDPLEAQIALARRVISSGSIDGVIGSQTRAALLTLQRQQGLPPPGPRTLATRWLRRNLPNNCSR